MKRSPIDFQIKDETVAQGEEKRYPLVFRREVTLLVDSGEVVVKFYKELENGDLELLSGTAKFDADQSWNYNFFIKRSHPDFIGVSGTQNSQFELLVEKV